MFLLDVILEPRRVPDTIRIPKPIVHDTLSVPADTTDTVVSSVNTFGGNLQLADIAPRPPHALAVDDFSTLIWSICVVLVALSLCFYFVKKYRSTKTS